jgi:hypothetical protein
VDAPAFEPRWNAPLPHAAAPPLVMSAFVLGWDNTLQVSLPSSTRAALLA